MCNPFISYLNVVILKVQTNIALTTSSILSVVGLQGKRGLLNVCCHVHFKEFLS